MGAGASVAHELTTNHPHHKHSVTLTGLAVGPIESNYNEMVEHLRTRFVDEMELFQGKYQGRVDPTILLCRLLSQELAFSTVEKNDLPGLAERTRDDSKIYVLGNSHFKQRRPSAGLVVSGLTPKALDLVGDDGLSAVARDALPVNAKVNKKAVELMGSTKVVTERKALKRLGSEMTEEMRVLQVKTERRELKEKEQEEERRGHATSFPDLSVDLGFSKRRPSSAICFDRSENNDAGGESEATGPKRTFSGIGSRLRSPSAILSGPAIKMNIRSPSKSMLRSPPMSTRRASTSPPRERAERQRGMPAVADNHVGEEAAGTPAVTNDNGGSGSCSEDSPAPAAGNDAGIRCDDEEEEDEEEEEAVVVVSGDQL